MDNNESSIKIQNTLTRVSCTFAFSLFTFFYLYYYQADLLTVMQHVFSKGQTHYNRFIGAVLITVVLLLLQVGFVNIFRKVRLAWAFTFVPPALCLVLLTDVHVSPIDGMLSFGNWVYIFPLALLAFVLLVWASSASGLSKTLGDLVAPPVRNLWANLCVVFLSILLVCLAGNADKTYHTRIYVEQCLMKGDIDKALDEIRKRGIEDENITMLTAYALSQKKTLAENLFEYRLNGGARALMPYGCNVKFELLPDTSFYAYLGNCYVQRMPTMKYLDYQSRHKRLNSRTIDYLLCGYLMDKKLDLFAREIVKYYRVNDSIALPKHYREALLLYTHLRSNPRIIYTNNVMNADFQDYQKLENSIADWRERKNALYETYGNTYWYYYQFCR